MSALRHYAAEPVAFDPARTYQQLEPSTFGKPVGLWVSSIGEDDWPSWVRENMNYERLAAAHCVSLANDANILHITTPEGIDHLSDRFAVQTDYERRWLWRDNDDRKWPIDWRAVSAEFDGILIEPYQWSRRMSHDWYYGWDCASGCIWNLSAIASADLIAAEVSA